MTKPTTLDEALKLIATLNLRLNDLNVRHADLLEASRASVAAYRDGEADPLLYVYAELDKRGQLPEEDMHPVQLLALCNCERRAS